MRGQVQIRFMWVMTSSVWLLIIFLSSFCMGKSSREDNDIITEQNWAELGGKLKTKIGPIDISKMAPKTQNNSEIIAQAGGTATLRCYTHFLGNELVTWMKREDGKLITAGRQVYSSENRYKIFHVRHQKLWELTINDVKSTDEGTYVCQVTKHPPAFLLYHLKVKEAKATIYGAKEIHVHEGSRVRLHCHVSHAIDTPEFIFWFHNETMVNYQQNRMLHVNKHRFSSTLTIENASASDAGSYRCEPHLSKPDQVLIHVVIGKAEKVLESGVSLIQSSKTTIFLSSLLILIIALLSL